MPKPDKFFYILFLCFWLILPHLSLAGDTRPANEIVFSSNASGKWDLWAVQPDGKNLRQVTRTDDDVLFPAISPDGRQVLFSDTKRQLQIMNIDGSGQQVLPLPNGIFTHPAWRPDGKEITFVSYTVLPSDQSELWCMERHAGGWKEPENISPYPPMRIFPSYSPDGKYLAYAEFRRDAILGVVEEIGILDLETNQFRLITQDQADSYQPVWSPGGDRIAYVSNKTGYYNIWVFDLSDNTHHPVTTDPSFDTDPAWSPNGEEIIFVSARTGNKEIWVISLISDQLRQITHIKKTCSHPFWVK
jgi:TolB protein